MDHIFLVLTLWSKQVVLKRYESGEQDNSRSKMEDNITMLLYDRNKKNMWKKAETKYIINSGSWTISFWCWPYELSKLY